MLHKKITVSDLTDFTFEAMVVHYKRDDMAVAIRRYSETEYELLGYEIENAGTIQLNCDCGKGKDCKSKIFRPNVLEIINAAIDLRAEVEANPDAHPEVQDVVDSLFDKQKRIVH